MIHQSILTRVLGCGVAALLASWAPSAAAIEIFPNTGPNTWVGGSDLPIWNVGGSGGVGFGASYAANWSFGINPGPLDDVLFPNGVPTFPLAGTFEPPLNTLTNGLTILLGSIFLDPNSLNFQNNYTLVDATVFAPLIFTGGKVTLPVTSGNVTVGAGFTATIDVNLLAVNGTLNKLGPGTLRLNDLVIGNVLVQQGVLGGNFTTTGNLVNMATLSPGNSPGTITVQGNFQQMKGATLALEIASATVFDQIIVHGTATLGGDANISLLGGYAPKRGQKFAFISANGISGQFDQVNAPVWDLLTLRPFYGKDTVTFEAVVNSFAALPGLTPNEAAVARNLDSVIYDPREAGLINYLYGKSLNRLPGLYDKIAPEELTSVFTIGTSLDQMQSLNLQRRTDDIRSGSSGFSAAGFAINGNGPSYSGGFGIATGVAGPSGDDGKEVKEMKQVAPEEKRWGAFLSGTGEWVSVGNTNNSHGYDLASGGFTLGVDYKVCPHFALGLMAGYTGSTANLTDGGRVYVNGGKIGLYGTTFVGGCFAFAGVSGLYRCYDTRRAALQGTARGDTDGGDLNVLFGTGYDFKAGGLTFGPTATFNYTYMGTNGFNETGSLAPLSIHGGDGESLRTAFGLKASYDWKVGGILIKPEIRAAWQHEYGDAAYALDSSLANGGGGTFTVNGPKLGRDSALLGAGFAVQWSDRCATYFYYDGELGRANYQSTSVTGGVRVAF